MRGLADRDRIGRFMALIGREAEAPARLYFTGGATAVLLGWRSTTVDVDIHIVPEQDRLFRAIPGLKESLQINVELACPAHFIPELPGWETRALFVEKHGSLAFYHYDLYSQALAKIERGHDQDSLDVREMLTRGLVEPRELTRLFGEIERSLYRFPAIDPPSFHRAVEEAVRTAPRPANGRG